MRGVTATLLCIVAHAAFYTPLAAQRVPIAEVPIAVQGDRTLIPVRIGRSGPFHLILDSGMWYDGILLFDTSGVDQTAFEQLAEVRVGGAGSGDASRGLSDPDASFSIGPLVMQHQRITMLTGGAWRRSAANSVIGYSLLGHYAVEIDYDRQLLLLHDAGMLPSDDWAPLAIWFKSDNRIPWTHVAVANVGGTSVTLEAYIDFAASEALELLTRDTNDFPMPVLTGDSTYGRGLSGDVRGLRGRMATVRLGQFVLNDVTVNLVPAAVRSRQREAQAVIGSGLLRRFNLVFDYPHQRIYLRPNRRFGEPFR